MRFRILFVIFKSSSSLYKFDNSLVNGKVKDINSGSNVLYILTTDGKLYATGQFSGDGTTGWPQDRYPGWEELQDFYTLKCLNCKILLPNYEKIAKKVQEKNNKIIFCKINMGDNEVANEEISSFPCIKLYPWNNKGKNRAKSGKIGLRSG